LDAWQAGWIDYASDYAYGTGIRPVAAPTATQETTVTPSVLSAESVADAIHAAMMAANACEATAPQDRAYGILADALKDALSTVYTQEQTNRIYAAVISSGESPSYVISEMPQTQEPVHEVYRVTMADAQGNITDVMPLGTDDVPADHPLNAHLTTAPRGRIVDTGRAARTR
jgi:delta 1-pyrroline-5-carboxylate dehydrogenase